MLLAVCTGRRVYIPEKDPGPENWMSRAIGLEKAAILASKLLDFVGEVDIPGNGRLLTQLLRQATAQRIVAGLAAGMSVSALMVDCGVSRRAVQMHKARLRASGLLPSIDPQRAAQEKYFGVTRRSEMPVTLPPADAVKADAAIGNLRPVLTGDEVSSTGPQAAKSSSREAQALAIIAQLHGEDARDRIREACKDRRVSLGRRPLERPDHPFRAVLDETEAKVVAIRIMGAGLGAQPLNFRKNRKAPTRWRSKTIAERLMDGHSVEQIARHLGVRPELVAETARDLRKHGKLTGNTSQFARSARQG